MAPGFVHSPTQYDLTVFFTRLMFPYIFFISLVALCMGILNSLRHFAAPALAPVVLNIAMIATSLTMRGLFREPLTALAIGVLIACGGGLSLYLEQRWLLEGGGPPADGGQRLGSSRAQTVTGSIDTIERGSLD